MQQSRAKEWIIIAAVIVLAAIVGVSLFLLNTRMPELGTNQETTTQAQLEGTLGSGGQSQATTSPEQSVTDPENETTGEAVTETTVQTTTGEEDPTEETTTGGDGGQSQKPTEGDGSSGAGFTDNNPVTESTPNTPTETTAPKETEKETEPEPTETMEPGKPVDEYTYEEYMALSKEEKTEFYYQFSSMAAFNRWYNLAKREYDENKLVIGDSSIDINDLLPNP